MIEILPFRPCFKDPSYRQVGRTDNDLLYFQVNITFFFYT